MIVQELTTKRSLFQNKDFHFQAEVFNKAIWGDMGEDSAQITITCTKDEWHLAFLRTQSGEPSAFDDFVCNIIDQYERTLSDEQLYDILTLHRLLPEFTSYCHELSKS